MRRFIIKSPGLSHGKPGDEVTADKLHMTDEQLDQFVDAGFAVEIHAQPPRRRPPSES